MDEKTQALIGILLIVTAFIILWSFIAYGFNKFKQIEIKCEQQIEEKRMWRNLANKREKELNKKNKLIKFMRNQGIKLRYKKGKN